MNNDHLSTLKSLLNKAIKFENKGRIERITERKRDLEHKKVEITFSFWVAQADEDAFENLISKAKELSVINSR